MEELMVLKNEEEVKEKEIRKVNIKKGNKDVIR